MEGAAGVTCLAFTVGFPGEAKGPFLVQVDDGVEGRVMSFNLLEQGAGERFTGQVACLQ